MTSHGARKRQHAFLAKQMRRQDDAVLDAIRDALAKDGDAGKRETAALHRAEAVRDGLMGDDGDVAMTELLAAHPDADRQKLRQLVRNAHEERKRNKPPRAYRELFRELRELLATATAMRLRTRWRTRTPELTPASRPPSIPRSAATAGPRPTGTDCPSLPQMPTPSSSAMSLPIIFTRCIVSGPLPISVAPFTGAVTLPSSIR
jgi:hypothetical protein